MAVFTSVRRVTYPVKRVHLACAGRKGRHVLYYAGGVKSAVHGKLWRGRKPFVFNGLRAYVLRCCVTIWVGVFIACARNVRSRNAQGCSVCALYSADALRFGAFSQCCVRNV